MSLPFAPEFPPTAHKIADSRHLPVVVLYGTDGSAEQRAPVHGVSLCDHKSDPLPVLFVDSSCMDK